MATNWYQSVNKKLPKAYDAEKMRISFDIFCDRCLEIKDENEKTFISQIIQDKYSQPFFQAIFGNSPFLTSCINSDPAFFCHLLSTGPDATFNEIMQGLEVNNYTDLTLETVQSILRVAKKQAALTIAVADISQIWDLTSITASLTELAQKTLNMAVGYLLYEAHSKGQIVLDYPETHPQKNSGLILLGMGKTGGFELNYSSDIDLIVLYDPEKMNSPDRFELGQNMVRLTKKIVKLMEERTKDGYVFRTDLRLRPDPGSTPLAITINAAETYYETIGQNWERAAMIKARPVAGDIEAGYAFLDLLRPFMWRKYMDFAALQDIHNIKRQINAHKGGSNVCLRGHNVKLGPGGIREIEFFAQTQQLIWGGRIPQLRIAPTCQALQQLVLAKQTDQKTCDDLIESYEFLRTVEHRLQMINDEQTHSIPEEHDDLERLCVFLGYEDIDSFKKKYIHHLKRVENHYAGLFEDNHDSQDEEGISGNLVFVGGKSDPATLKTLNDLGFDNPEFVDNAIRGWHHARYRATKSLRAREILTELMEPILLAFSKTVDPDKSFLRFDQFLAKLPSGIQLFSLFKMNPLILDLVAEIMGESPRLSQHLAKHPGLLEFVLTPGFFKELPSPALLQKDLETRLQQARDYQDILDITRRWTNDRKFQIGVHTIREVISVEESLMAHSQIADCVIQVILEETEKEIASKHGVIEGASFSIMAFGKAGSRELTATSDLDLVFIYEANSPNDMSDGERPLGVGQYFTRLSQRFINAMMAPTGEGSLYEVDVRLRPSGTSGPMAASFEAFKKYYDEAAWTWEYMALSRARVITGTPSFKSKIKQTIKSIITRKRDPEKLRLDVADMRERMAKEHVAKTIWSIKHWRGGIVDIDFICQYLLLKHAHDHPDINCCNSLDVLTAAQHHKILDYSQASELISALKLWNIIQGYLRLTIEDTVQKQNGDELPEALKEDLVAATKEKDFNSLYERMHKSAALVRNHYDAILSLSDEPIANKNENGDNS